MVCGALLISIAIAALVTLTTRVSDMLDVCQRMLRPLGHWASTPTGSDWCWP